MESVAVFIKKMHALLFSEYRGSGLIKDSDFIDWFAAFSDLNLIANLCGNLGRAFYTIDKQYDGFFLLVMAITYEGTRIKRSVLQRLVNFILNRCVEVQK